VSKYLYETLMMPKIRIAVFGNLQESTELFAEKINAKQGTIIYSSSTKLSVQEDESVQESLEQDEEEPLVASASGGGGGGGRFEVLDEELEDEPGSVFASTNVVVPNSGGGSYEDVLKTRLREISFEKIIDFAMSHTKELKKINFDDKLKKRVETFISEFKALANEKELNIEIKNQEEKSKSAEKKLKDFLEEKENMEQKIIKLTQQKEDKIKEIQKQEQEVENQKKALENLLEKKKSS
jgi:hypothetical protein